ncbi:RsmD family RNA methyltransferase [Candidatus Parcubacteria bacterium]|nr:RsmD family RNA methyltransferase [Patescibacteria group bacterium]MCG2688953.1 RsmD family RNA methyltransferase [Candidatus Parcubacteria bacterium]
MHITSGIAKNRLISVPESAKPIKGIVLNSIFSTIGDEIKNKRCLDLFAGSGALGLEALSRGAKFCKFSDSDYNAISCIKTNVANANFSNLANVEKIDAVKYIGNTTDKFDIIFLDPPYNSPITHILKNIFGVASGNCVLVYLCDSKTKNEQTEAVNFNLTKLRKFGKTTIQYFVLDK